MLCANVFCACVCVCARAWVCVSVCIHLPMISLSDIINKPTRKECCECKLRVHHQLHAVLMRITHKRNHTRDYLCTCVVFLHWSELRGGDGQNAWSCANGWRCARQVYMCHRRRNMCHQHWHVCLRYLCHRRSNMCHRHRYMCQWNVRHRGFHFFPVMRAIMRLTHMHTHTRTHKHTCISASENTITNTHIRKSTQAHEQAQPRLILINA